MCIYTYVHMHRKTAIKGIYLSEKWKKKTIKGNYQSQEWISGMSSQQSCWIGLSLLHQEQIAVYKTSRNPHSRQQRYYYDMPWIRLQITCQDPYRKNKQILHQWVYQFRKERAPWMKRREVLQPIIGSLLQTSFI